MTAEIAIHIEHLSKIYGRGRRRIFAVKDVTLNIQPGQVYGLLGPNGAGKTTLIRMMLGLILPTQGRVLLDGRDVRTQPEVLRRVGAIVEGPAAYNYLSGRGNLEVLARTSGHFDPARINALLKQVGLDGRADQWVRGYSLGMKQRLGLAAALLDDPDLVILDEPTNGLDPNGIQELRVFIRELVDKHGKTVCLSSHLLNEVEQICDRVAIINKGEIVREGVVADLLAEKSQLRIDAVPRDQAAAVLRAQWIVSDEPNGSLILNAAHSDVPNVIRQLVQAGIDVYEVAIQHQTLEQYFFEATQPDLSTTIQTEAVNA